MKTTRTLRLLAACLLAAVLASCGQREATAQQSSSLTVRIGNVLSGGQQPASALDITSASVALYLASTGDLVSARSWSGEGRTVTFDALPGAECLVYAVANCAFEWPSTAGGLSKATIATGLSQDTVPLASGPVAWNGTDAACEMLMRSLYSKVTVLAGPYFGYELKRTAVDVMDWPVSIPPFGDGTAAEHPTGRTAAVRPVSRGSSSVVFVPSEGKTKLLIDGTTQSAGSEQQDTYLVSVPRTGTEDQSVSAVGGIGGRGTIFVSIDNDNRVVELLYGEPSTLIGIKTGDCAVNRISAYAKDGTKGWTTPLSWKGVSALEGLATVRVGYDGEKHSLGKDGSIDVPATAPGEYLPVYVQSAYEGPDCRRVNFNTVDRNFTVQFEAKYKKYIQFHFLADSNVVGLSGLAGDIGIDINYKGADLSGTSALSISEESFEYFTEKPAPLSVTDGDEKLEFTITVKAKTGDGHEIAVEPLGFDIDGKKPGNGTWYQGEEWLEVSQEGCTYKGTLTGWTLENGTVTYDVRIYGF